MKIFLTEAVGTFFLTLVIALAGKSDFAPLAIGAVLMVLVYAGGYISGAHYNPAVSLSVALSRGIQKGAYKWYVLSQVIGAFLGAVFAVKMTGESFAPGSTTLLFAPLFAEILFTFALCYVVLHTAVSKASKGNQYFGLAIGGTLMVSAIAGGPISGAVLNPAVGIGAFLASLLTHGTMSVTTLALTIAGPAIGAVLAAVIFGMQRE
jgi:aquaporin Z